MCGTTPLDLLYPILVSLMGESYSRIQEVINWLEWWCTKNFKIYLKLRAITKKKLKYLPHRGSLPINNNWNCTSNDHNYRYILPGSLFLGVYLSFGIGNLTFSPMNQSSQRTPAIPVLILHERWRIKWETRTWITFFCSLPGHIPCRMLI